ncbi:S1 family peptidase [Sorangium sp. So ce119]|uniref:S1 family peptidase n=1 Tax=Sorangium sp. So ce119 TaxID=3133279 RepID=UPI003F616E90
MSRAGQRAGLTAAAVAMLGCSGAASSSADDVVAHAAPIYNGAPTSAWSGVVALDEVCTGVLIHPEVVLYAAHCGTGFVSARASSGASRAVDACWMHPEAAFYGTDIAICRLAEAFDDVEVIPPVLGCEEDAITPGADVLMVGYGAHDDQDHGLGIKRAAPAKIEDVGAEIVVRSAGVGTCAGDSGGPALVRVDGRAWRVAGVLSAGETYDCGDGPSYYTPVAGFVQWIEQQTRCDVSPCGAPSGQWAPSPDCRDHDGAAAEDPVAGRVSGPFSSTCGEPFGGDVADVWPPSVRIEARSRTLVASEQGTASVEIAARVSDTGWGVRQAELSIVDELGRPRARESHSLGADAFGPFDLEIGSYEIRLVARDFAENTAEGRASVEVVALDAPAGGCGISRPAGASSGAPRWMLAALGVIHGVRRAARRPRGARPARITPRGGHPFG